MSVDSKMHDFVGREICQSNLAQGVCLVMVGWGISRVGIKICTQGGVVTNQNSSDFFTFQLH